MQNIWAHYLFLYKICTCVHVMQIFISKKSCKYSSDFKYWDLARIMNWTCFDETHIINSPHKPTFTGTCFANTTSSSQVRYWRYWRSGAKKCFDRKTHKVLAARDKSASHQPSLACHCFSSSHHLCSAALMLLAKAQCLQERTQKTPFEMQTENIARALHKRSVVPGLKNATFAPHGG